MLRDSILSPDVAAAAPRSPARRAWFQSAGQGLHAAALTWLLGRDLFDCPTAIAGEPSAGGQARRRYDLKPRQPHFEPRAKSVIHLFMNGGPSQMDLFDPKPELDKRHGESYFEKIAGEVENPGAAGALMRCPYKFAQHGKSGTWVSDAMPQLATCVDDIAILRSMYTVNLTHEPALFIIHGGRMVPGLPSMGAWVTYGLGSENQNLPAYVVLDDPKGLPINRTQNWQSGFLPPLYQGTRFRSTGSPVLNLSREFDEPDRVTGVERQLLAGLDRIHRTQRVGQPNLDARIASYELAARMQLAASNALDLKDEDQGTLEMYGIGKEPTDSYGRRCLYARRLVERGVRFVQLFIDAQIWDSHTSLKSGLKSACDRTDKPVAGLLKDLKQRGLLNETLVVWGGEFGRLPIAQLPGDKNVENAGRDHNKNAMVSWMAGGGIKGGISHGETDPLGFAATEKRVGVPDFHATILHQLGLHHEELYYLRNGLKERLTGVQPAQVITDILS